MKRLWLCVSILVCSMAVVAVDADNPAKTEGQKEESESARIYPKPTFEPMTFEQYKTAYPNMPGYVFGDAPTTFGRDVGPSSVETPLTHVRIEIRDAPAVADRLIGAGFDVLEGTISKNRFEVIVSDACLQILTDKGFKPQVISVGRPFKDIQAQRKGKLAPLAIPRGYQDLAGILVEMDAAQVNYPSICKVVDLTAAYGTPATFDGRHMFAIKISDNVTVDEDEPTYLVVSNHHAREVITPVIALYAIEQFTTQYGIDPNITALVDEYEIWIAPTWNPDGYEHVFYVDNYWRKNRRVLAGGTGVDQNRNYPFGWDASCGGRTRVTSNNYRGPSPASEAETQTMIAWSQDRHFAKLIDFHSRGRETLYAYANCIMTHPFTDFLQQEAINISNQAGYSGRVRHPSAMGEHYEWQLAKMGVHAFLTETYINTYQPSYAEAQNEAVVVFPCIIWQLQRAIPLSGHVTDFNTGLPIAATINYVDVGFQNDEINSSDERFGRYYLFVPDGTYTLEFSATGYLTQSHTIEVISSTAKVFNVALVPDPDFAPVWTFNPTDKFEPLCAVKDVHDNKLPNYPLRFRLDLVVID